MAVGGRPSQDNLSCFLTFWAHWRGDTDNADDADDEDDDDDAADDDNDDDDEDDDDNADDDDDDDGYDDDDDDNTDNADGDNGDTWEFLKEENSDAIWKWMIIIIDTLLCKTWLCSIQVQIWVHLFNTSANMSSPVQYKGFQRVWVVPVARVLPDSTHRPVRPAGDEQTYDNYDDDDKNLDDDNDDDGDDDKIVLSGSTRKPVFPAGDEQALRKS